MEAGGRVRCREDEEWNEAEGRTESSWLYCRVQSSWEADTCLILCCSVSRALVWEEEWILKFAKSCGIAVYLWVHYTIAGMGILISQAEKSLILTPLQRLTSRTALILSHMTLCSGISVTSPQSKGCLLTLLLHGLVWSYQPERNLLLALGFLEFLGTGSRKWNVLLGAWSQFGEESHGCSGLSWPVQKKALAAVCYQVAPQSSHSSGKLGVVAPASCWATGGTIEQVSCWVPWIRAGRSSFALEDNCGLFQVRISLPSLANLSIIAIVCLNYIQLKKKGFQVIITQP